MLEKGERQVLRAWSVWRKHGGVWSGESDDAEGESGPQGFSSDEQRFEIRRKSW